MAATVAVSVKQPSLGTKYDRWLQNVTSLRSGWKGVAEKFLEAKEIYLKEKSALEGAGYKDEAKVWEKKAEVCKIRAAAWSNIAAHFWPTSPDPSQVCEFAASKYRDADKLEEEIAKHKTEYEVLDFVFDQTGWDDGDNCKMHAEHRGAHYTIWPDRPGDSVFPWEFIAENL